MEDKNKKPSMTELRPADLDDQPVMSRRARRRRADEEEAAQVDLTQPAEETEFPVDEPTVEFKPIRSRADEPAAPKPVPRKKRPPRVVELPEEDGEEEEEIEEVRKPARVRLQPSARPSLSRSPRSAGFTAMRTMTTNMMTITTIMTTMMIMMTTTMTMSAEDLASASWAS